jgi:hypothetical protein
MVIVGGLFSRLVIRIFLTPVLWQYAPVRRPVGGVTAGPGPA